MFFATYCFLSIDRCTSNSFVWVALDFPILSIYCCVSFILLIIILVVYNFFTNILAICIFLIPFSVPHLSLSRGISKSLVFFLSKWLSVTLYLYLSECVMKSHFSTSSTTHVTCAIVKFLVSYPKNKCKMIFCYFFHFNFPCYQRERSIALV